MATFTETVEVQKDAGDVVITLEPDGTISEPVGGQRAIVVIGGPDHPGALVLRDGDGQEMMRLAVTRFFALPPSPGGFGAELSLGDAASGEAGFTATNSGLVILGRSGRGGNMLVFDQFGKERFHLNADEGEIAVRNDDGDDTILLKGGSGDITLLGADCAELFEVAAPDGIEPGTVLVLDDEALLRPCREPYDRRVAGIVSGAGGLRPGVTLGAVAGANRRAPVALAGRAYCKVDAEYGPVGIGDLLTSSATPGHAMAARDATRAFGAVIGKSLAAHDAGQGLVPVLVALQ